MKALRIATLVLVPSLVAAIVTMRGHDGLLGVAAPTLIVMWMVMIGVLVMRFIGEVRSPASGTRPSPWDHLDVLTATGGSVLWMGAVALGTARLTGWASLSVIGILGIGAVYLAATWTAIVAGGDRPWRTATVTREILPATAVEGEPLREEVRLTGVRIPAGMRMFAIGRATRYGLVTRYAVSSEGSFGDVKLESELGNATRGDHHAPPLALWLGDVLGLTRTPVIHRGEASFSVLPRPFAVDNVTKLLGHGGAAATSSPTHKLPTEGTFRIREYVPGDDTRRIHWVRSLQANQLVVRLPDEVPPAEPKVRLILDNHLVGTEGLTCRAPDELLDALVRVWLSVGNVLAASGTRVTLATAAQKGDAIAVVERVMLPRSPRSCQQLGARVGWQSSVPLPALLARGAMRQVVVSSRSRPIDSTADVLWVVVPEVAWTSREPWPPPSAPVTLPFPSGTADNRFGRRLRERRRIEARGRDRAVFSQIMCKTEWAAFSGAYVARPNEGRIALTVIP